VGKPSLNAAQPYAKTEGRVFLLVPAYPGCHVKRLLLYRYVQAIKHNRETGVKADGRRVISMSLYGKDPYYTWGLLRNAQLVPVYLPDWTLRVYVAASDTDHPELAVPPRIISKLRLLGADVRAGRWSAFNVM